LGGCWGRNKESVGPQDECLYLTITASCDDDLARLQIEDTKREWHTINATSLDAFSQVPCPPTILGCTAAPNAHSTIRKEQD